MKNEEVRTKNEGKDAEDKGKSPSAAPQPRPEPGAESQLHNYNVILSRLGDLFAGDEEPPGRKK